MKKIFDNQVSKWQKEEKQTETLGSVHSIENANEEEFNVDVRLYKERDDDFRIIGNKLQYRASEQAEPGRNYSHK